MIDNVIYKINQTNYKNYNKHKLIIKKFKKI